LLAAVLLETLLGGFSPTGASTNTGWFALIVALMCIPFGGLLLALGVAKWLRNRGWGAIARGRNMKHNQTEAQPFCLLFFLLTGVNEYGQER
jgi:high-affinity K+ transport system ATPase subunit B